MLATIAHAAVTLTLQSAPQPTEPIDERPNILLIMADDLGPEWIGCYGGELAKTPHIDALAARGLRYENAWSMPKCTPTRATLLTGQYPFRHGWVNHWDVPRWGAGCHFDPNRNPSIASHMRRAGYATAIAGKWQVADFRVQPNALDACGFDDWCVWTGYETGNPPSGERYADAYVHRRNGSRTEQGRFGPDVFTEFLCEFASRHKDEPWFAYYPMVLTHGPMTNTPDEPDVTGMARFAAMVRYTDTLVGRLAKHLESIGELDDTVIVFTGDNGSPRGINGRRDGREVKGGKGQMTETGANVPFVVAGSGVVQGRSTPALLDFTDLLPTCVALAGAELPIHPTCDGVDQSTVWAGSRHGVRDWALTMGGGVAVRSPSGVVPRKLYADRAVRNDRYKLWVENGEPSKLFDLTNDPHEEQNLLDVESVEVATAIGELTAVLDRFPDRDATPKYAPTPAQQWDRKVVPDHDRGAPRVRRQARRPNVILMMADDLGWGDVGFNGGTRIRTPHLDKMAQAGLRFERFYSAAPVCSPTRGSCLTGRHPMRYGIPGANSGHLPKGEVNLAAILKGHGYTTGHFGKWHLGTLTKTVRESNRGGPKGAAHYAPPWERSFDVSFSTEAKVPTYDPMKHPDTGKPYGTHYWSGPGQMVEDENLNGDDSELIVDRFVPFARRAVADETPFFAVIWFHAPHLPIVAGEEDLALYPGLPEKVRHYRGCITALDRQVGRVRSLLRELGVEQDTMLWFCSDNGPEGKSDQLGTTAGLRGRKRSLYEGGVRVPGLVEWPAEIQAGTSTSVPAVTSDYVPTVLASLGIPEPDVTLDGADLTPIWQRGAEQRGKGIGFNSRRWATWVEDRYKLVATPKGGYELYDLLQDRGETNDLAADQIEVTRDMRARLEAWLATLPK